MRPRPLALATVLVAPLALAPPLLAQRAAAFGLAVAGPSTYVTDGSGLTLRGGVGASGAAEVAWPVGGAYAAGVGARVGVVPLRVHALGGRYAAGTATEATLAATARCALGARAIVRGGLGVTYAHGPSDVGPFRAGASVHPAAEAGVAARLGARSPLWAELTATAYRVATSDAVQHAGSVGRLLLGVRYAR